jgi:thiol:disulfide interchange protein
MKKILLSFVTILLFTAAVHSQIIKPVKWSHSVKTVDNAYVDLIFKATIQSPWHLYGLHVDKGGPLPTSITFTEAKGFEITGEPTQSPEPEITDDPIFKMKVELHSKQVTFTQRIRKTGHDSISISGVLEYQICNDMQCVLDENSFDFRLAGLGAETDNINLTDIFADNSANDTASGINAPDAGSDVTATDTGTARGSLWGILLLSLLAGLGGLLTPCVYPMIPLTVSFFMRGNKSRMKGISEALVFGLSIVFIYTLIGALVAIFKNPNAVNNVTTHWITNSVFFLIFLTLSASFFGMFEITLPSGLANRVDQKADKGGYIGAFFMALTMAILSFSCTGPIVASLLIKASQGNVLEPVVGMAGFSVILALPFTLFAIFPSWIKSLPKSGGWLNTIKVFFAFIMLAFSIYFLGKIDQVYHLNLLPRPLFLSIWIVIFFVLGLYFLGKIRFAHDDETTSMGFPRLILAIASFSFAIFLASGLFGNDLKGLSPILPPQEKASLSGVSLPSASESLLCNEPGYADLFELPEDYEGYFDLEEALNCARQQNKPVLVDFVGHSCSNCKKMYGEVWSDPRVKQLLKEKFIIAALYTDDKTRLPENEWITSTVDGKVKNTIGKKNQDLQITRFNSNALPLYAVVNHEGADINESYYTYSPDIEKFIEWLNKALQ